MPFRRHSALFFLPFLKISEVPNRHQRPFLPSVNMEKGFTSQSDGLATTHQVPLRYLLRNGTAAFHRWSSGYSAQFLPSSLVWLSQQVRFGLLCKIFSQCWTLRNQRKGKDVKQGFGSPTNCSWRIAPLGTSSGSDPGLQHHHESHRTIRVMAFCVNAVFHAR